jgi:Plasmid pRiA4b ORF-3-like protein
MRPYFTLFPPGEPVETRSVIARGAKGLPDGTYRFVEFYCDEPDCDCRRVVIQVWNKSDTPLATFNYGWESPEFYTKWSKSGDPAVGTEMASLTPELFGPQSPYTRAFLAELEEAIGQPGYVEKLRRHYAEFRTAVEAHASRRQRRQKIAPVKAKKKKTRANSIYQLKITLRGTEPPIWRRVQTPGEIALAALHDIIQTAMGWTDSHLHCFRTRDATYSSPDPGGDFEDSDDESELDVRLDEACPRVKTKMIYEYDFGDSWEHEVVVEKIIPPEPGVSYPVCLAGEWACPPEDCGGVWSYADLLEALKDPEHEMHEDGKEILGDDWHAEAFDIKIVNRFFAPRRRKA